MRIIAYAENATEHVYGAWRTVLSGTRRKGASQLKGELHVALLDHQAQTNRRLDVNEWVLTVCGSDGQHIGASVVACCFTLSIPHQADLMHDRVPQRYCNMLEGGRNTTVAT